MNKKALEFRNAIEALCGEANEAARLSPDLFSEDELYTVKRELARILEIVEMKVLPIYRHKFPEGQ